MTFRGGFNGCVCTGWQIYGGGSRKNAHVSWSSSIISELTNFVNRFSENYKFCFKLTTTSIADVYMYADRLQKKTSQWFGTVFCRQNNKCLYFKSHLKILVLILEIPKIQDMCAFLGKKKVRNIYCYSYFSLIIFLRILISKSSTKRSFSALTRVNSYLRQSSKKYSINRFSSNTNSSSFTFSRNIYVPLIAL